MSPPVGPTGVTTCRGDEDGDANAAAPKRTVVRVAVGYSYSWTVLTFSGAPGGDTRAEFAHHAVVVTGEMPVGSRGVVQIGAGGLGGGKLDTDASPHDMGPGWMAFASYAHRFVDQRGAYQPFLLGSVTAGASVARTEAPGGESERLTAYDVRAGLTLGKSFGPATPYVGARGFFGPVFWTQQGHALTGQDKHHYQTAIGLALAAKPVDVSLECAFAGEQSLGVGVGISF